MIASCIYGIPYVLLLHSMGNNSFLCMMVDDEYMNVISEASIRPVDFMKALADDTRMTSMVLLLEGSLCVCDLMDRLALSQPKVSRHLALLRDAGLVTTERRGQWIFYSIASDLPTWVMNTLVELRSPTLLAAKALNPAFSLDTGEQSQCC
jgi:ArsR family transcriptional regulator